MSQKKSRNFIADWNNWPFELYINGRKHRKESYFKIDRRGYKDLFDALRAALWQNRAEKRAVLTGCMWESEWLGIQNGIIPKEWGTPMFGHSFCFIGQKTINGEFYLVAQLSSGKEVGDNGLFYFPREVVNAKCTFGNYMFKDMDVDIAKELAWGVRERIINILKRFINQVLK